MAFKCMKGVYASLVWMDSVRAPHPWHGSRDGSGLMSATNANGSDTRERMMRTLYKLAHSHKIISGAPVIIVKLLVRPYVLVCDIWLFFEQLARICVRRMEPVCASIPSRSTSSKCPYLGISLILSSARDSSHERVVRDASHHRLLDANTRIRL